jgi:beta-xylosidase
MPDCGDGSYRNPVLHADYSDPDILRHGDDFFLVASSFTCTPGLPILHSRDLVNWRLVNHALRQVPHPSYAAVRPGCGVWAPSIRFYAGKFWIFFPMPDEGIYVTTAGHPTGAWSEPFLLQAAKGWIDPCPFWDDDGQAYLAHAYANSRAGKRDKIHLRPMAPDCSRLLGEGSIVIDTPEHPYLEGPKMHKKDGWYYIMAPGGGVPQGWQVCFRSKHIYGPYEQKIVLEKGSTAINGPHQGAFVDLPNGEWWFAHFQDAGAFGRIMHLQPVVWEAGWPVVGVDYDGNGVGEPVPSWKKPAISGPAQKPEAPASSDDFDAPVLGLQWQWQGNHDPAWADLASRPGWLRLTAQPHAGLDLTLAPHFLGQKFPARSFEAETLVDPASLRGGDLAFFGVVGGKECAALGLRPSLDGVELVQVLSGALSVVGGINTSCVRLKVSVSPDGTCSFAMATPTGPFANLPATFKASEGGWLGARIGFCCLTAGPQATGAAEFDHLRFA